MNNLDEMLNPKWRVKLTKPIGLSEQISEILRVKERFSGSSKMAEIAGGFNARNLFSNPALSAMETMRQSLTSRVSIHQTMLNAIGRSGPSKVGIPKSIIDSFDSRARIPKSMMAVVGLTRVNIPQSALDAITSISSHHERLLRRITASTSDSLRMKALLSGQINNLDFVLKNISGQVAAIAAYEKNWDLIDDLSTVTEQAAEFAESIAEETEENVNRVIQALRNFVSAFILKYKELSKDPIALFVIFITLHQYIDFLTKPDAATKENIKRLEVKIDNEQNGLDSLKNVIHSMTEVFKKYGLFRINRICEIKLKPKIKSLTLDKLPYGYEVIELQVNHKWVYISYYDSMDGIPKMGWIMKKYLSKP